VNTQDREDGKSPAESEAALVASAAAAEDKRIAARRRFLKMGAGGSTAVMVTIAHRRAFAGMKKGQIISNCVSLQGVPDLKGMNQKKALQLSPMGTPKGVQCNPKPATNQCVADQPSKYYNAQGLQVAVVRSSKIKDGCGNLTDTLFYQKDFRLYDKGYCPVILSPSGELTYDTTAVFYEKKDCDLGKPMKDGVCTDLGVKDKDKVVTFVLRQCE